ncbi:MAG TPA: hypothetical protein VKG80_19480 [Trebonia sp.]|nr:hypothetical protein [Trebonia sp.]
MKIPARQCSRVDFPVPAGLDPGLAAALGVAGLVGWVALDHRGHLQTGETVLVLADDQAIDAALAAAVPGGYDLIIDFLWGALAPHAMNHASVGARYIQVGSSAGPTSTISAPAFRNKALTLVGHGLAGTPAEVRRSAYAQLMRHAIDGKFTVDLERTRLDDISQTWEHLKAGPPCKLVVTP